MSFATKAVPAGSRRIAVRLASVYSQPGAGMICGTSSRRKRWVNVAAFLSDVAAGYPKANEVPAVTMYSYAGPVIVEPSGFSAIGNATDAVRLVPKSARVTSGSHPLHTRVYPRGIRNEFASIVGSVMVAGSLP